VSRLSRQCGIPNISQPYRPPRPVTGITLLFIIHGTVSISRGFPKPQFHIRTWSCQRSLPEDGIRAISDGLLCCTPETCRSLFGTRMAVKYKSQIRPQRLHTASHISFQLCITATHTLTAPIQRRSLPRCPSFTAKGHKPHTTYVRTHRHHPITPPRGAARD
jgi:hypothetical protein